jgi:hypothetical protein
MRKFVLVYQVGIANVFERTADGVTRKMQHAYRPCEDFARGLLAADCAVDVMHCDVAGDVASFADEWKPGKGSLWEESKHPPRTR